ncbi:MAG: hypothetical protein R6U01_04510 [Halorubrum sp.]|uniref:hypothetical protein n=1 Tax=Halorubrum sp. TaxID=1879286 RepID=UPI0039706EA1
MSLRSAVLDFLACDGTDARSALRTLLADSDDTERARGLDPHRLPRTRSAVAPPAAVADSDDLTDRDRRLI